jgi:hypothetical protein
MAFMANITPDRQTLRALADEGNETALERLADLVDVRDLDEPHNSLDEGSQRAVPTHATRSRGGRTTEPTTGGLGTTKPAMS